MGRWSFTSLSSGGGGVVVAGVATAAVSWLTSLPPSFSPFRSIEVDVANALGDLASGGSVALPLRSDILAYLVLRANSDDTL